MTTILNLSHDGYGVFSLQGLSIILSCWVVLMAIHPWSMSVSRASDFLRSLTSSRKNLSATEMHGLDSSPANTVGGSYLLRGEALIPGFFAFILGLSSEIFGTSSSVFYALSDAENSTRFLILVGMVGFLASGALDNAKISCQSLFWSRLSGLGNILTYGSIILVFIVSHYSSVSTLSYVVLGISMRVLGAILARGLHVYRTGALLWVPVHWMTWGVTTLIMAYLGPIYFILARLVDKPGFASLPLGAKRASHVDEGEIVLPRSYALDTLGGMISPR